MGEMLDCRRYGNVKFKREGGLFYEKNPCSDMRYVAAGQSDLERKNKKVTECEKSGRAASLLAGESSGCSESFDVLAADEPFSSDGELRRISAEINNGAFEREAFRDLNAAA